MERKKTSLFILGLSILLLSVVGVTYAYWTLNLEQTDEDKLASSCFDITMENEHDAIKLDKAYPISDKEGEELTPYTFTITNKCNANAKYQINLESLSKINNNTFIDVGNRLNAQYLKVKLNEENKEGSMHLLHEDKVEHTLKDAYESHRLTIGYLGPRESKTYELRLWLDGDLTIDDTDAMNKTFAGKVTITATYSKNKYDTLVNTILALKPEEEDSGNSGIYKVEHTDASITYTSDSFYQNRLKQIEYRYAGSDPKNYVDVGEEKKYGLFVCMNIEGIEMCQNLNNMPNSGVEKFYTDSASCEAKRTDEELKSMLDNMASGQLYSLNCDLSSLWRIIGLVNTPEGQRVKLIKDTSIGNYSWDSSESDVNNGNGVNEWSQSDLMKLLNPGYETNKEQICDEDQCTNDNLVNNSLYWDGESGKCYIDENNTATDCDFINNKMPDKLKKMIETIIWNTGAGDENYDYDIEETVSKFYEYERSSNTGKICDNSGAFDYECNDEIERTTSWKGKVGLIYLSDYLYANGWLLSSGEHDWILLPIASSSRADYVQTVGSSFVTTNAANNKTDVRPSVYLKPDVLVSSGNGSKDSPYVLEI